MENVPVIVQFLVGLGLLLAGRRLFWLFVGGAAFLVGFMLAQEYLPDQGENARLVLAVGIGLAGAALAYVAQKIALSLGGFLAGGFLGATLVRELLALAGPAPAVAFLVGGVVGLVLIHVIFDWALTLLSAVAGAYVIGQMLPLEGGAQLVVVAVLAALGVAVQKRMFGDGTEKRRPRVAEARKAKDQGSEPPSEEPPEA